MFRVQVQDQLHKGHATVDGDYHKFRGCNRGIQGLHKVPTL